jgi:hypothetical protein
VPAPKKQELSKERRHLASMIDAALKKGQRGDGVHETTWAPWSNVAFANKVVVQENTVRGWRNVNKPVPPVNIMRALHVFYGDQEKFAEARTAMLKAWRRATGTADDPAPGPREIETKEFADFVDIVDLSVRQPVAGNIEGTLTVPYTLRIHPGMTDSFADQKVEIGVTEPLLAIDSQHWKPSAESVFRSKDHGDTKSVAVRNAVLISGPTDGRGRIDGSPLKDEPTVTMEPVRPNAGGPITFQLSVPREGFVVTPCGAAGDVSITQKVVLDAIFAQGIAMDKRKRLIVAGETVRPPAAKETK